MHRSLIVSTALVTTMSMILNVPVSAQTTTEVTAEAQQACETPVGEPCLPDASLTVEQAGELKAQQMDAELSQDMDKNVRDQSIQQARIQAEDAQREYLDTLAAASTETDATATESAAAPTDPAATDPATAEATTDAATTDTATADPATAETTTTDTTTATAEPETPAASADMTATTSADTSADTTTTPSSDATATTSADGQTTTETDTTTTTTAEEVPLHQQREPTNAELAAAPAIAAAAAAASGDASAEEPTMTEETITADEVRSSDEDFANAVNEAPEATADTNATATASSDSGMSDKQKAILGLGALAIGALALANKNRDVVSNSGDRVIVREGDEIYVLKDDNALLRQSGSKVETATYDDGSTKQTITREDGSKIVTVRDAELRVLRRVRIEADGHETVLFDDTVEFRPVDRAALRDTEMQPEIQSSADEAALRAALSRNPNLGRVYSLAQVRNTPELRAVAPAVSLEAVTFRSGSAAIEPEQVDALVQLGEVIKSSIKANPAEVFLIEGHTDAVGDDAYNLTLSDRRAETVALALTEYFDVPPENLVVQGYGEKFLKVQTQSDERRNRRAVVRRITPLLTASR